MADNRHRPRKNTPHPVKAFDVESGKALGRIVDITADGMMIITGRNITPGRTFLIRINLPAMVRNRTEVQVETRVIWCEQDHNPSYYKVGCQFLNLRGEEGFLLEDVMHKFNLVG